MTTHVIGKKWMPGVGRISPVDEILSYQNGMRRAFDSYLLDPRHEERSISVTDGPSGTLLRWAKGVIVFVNGRREAPPAENFQLETGSTMKVKGPSVDGQQAELKITYEPSVSKERQF